MELGVPFRRGMPARCTFEIGANANEFVDRLDPNRSALFLFARRPVWLCSRYFSLGCFPTLVEALEAEMRSAARRCIFETGV